MVGEHGVAVEWSKRRAECTVQQLLPADFFTGNMPATPEQRHKPCRSGNVQREPISTEFALAVRHRALGARKRHHVLLVEADPAVRDARRMLLKTDGYQVTAVEAGAV